MIRALLLVLFMVMSANAVQAADLTEMTCEQNDVVVLRFNNDRAEKRRDSKVIRFEANTMYANDANGQEHAYPVRFISGPRYQAENWTMIFNPDLTSADVALVTMTDVQIARWRCKKTDKK